MVAFWGCETIESSAVRIVRHLILLLTARMKSYTLVFVALATVLLCTEYINAMETCPQENCIMPNHCEQLIRNDHTCHQQGTSCCSVVKSEFRTHCRHHGGECMESCPSVLTRETVDCTGAVCCVLV